MYHVSSLCTIQRCYTTFVSSWSLPWSNWTFILKAFKDAWPCKDTALHRPLEQSSSSLAVHRLHRDYSPCRSTRSAFREYGKSGEDLPVLALLKTQPWWDEKVILRAADSQARGLILSFGCSLLLSQNWRSEIFALSILHWMQYIQCDAIYSMRWHWH